MLDLVIGLGRIQAVVSGSRPRPYDVEIKVKPLATAHWARIKARCGGEIGSLIELLEGRLSDRVMGMVTDREQGLFPKPKEIEMTCSCPDWATMCKHVAAVMYGVGARLDAQPELLFTLRKVDHGELIAEAARIEVSRSTRRKTIEEAELADVFGIELAEAPDAPRSRAADKPAAPPAHPPAKRPARKSRVAGGTRKAGKAGKAGSTRSRAR